jgi:transcriptional regulator with XRE-family HTH domain
LHQNNDEDFGGHVRASRLSKHVTLRAFAKRLGIAPSQLSNIENGLLVPDPDVIRRIATELEEDVDQLFALAGKLTPEAIRAFTRAARSDPKFFRSMVERMGGAQ